MVKYSGEMGKLVLLSIFFLKFTKKFNNALKISQFAKFKSNICAEPFAVKKLLDDMGGEVKISSLTTDRSPLVKKLLK